MKRMEDFFKKDILIGALISTIIIVIVLVGVKLLWF